MRNLIVRSIAGLKFHELLCIGMIVFIEALYRIGSPEHRSGIVTVIERTVHDGSPITKLYVVLLVAFAIATSLLRRGRVKAWASFMLRMMSFLVTILFSFEAMTYYIELRGLEMKDPLLLRWESYLFFGKQAAEWLEPWNSDAAIYILSGVYLAWLFFVYGTILLLSFRGKQAVIEYMTAAILMHFIGHTLYVLVPALGPLYAHQFATPMGGITAMFTSNKLSTHADAFPSLHTAVSVVMAVQIWRSFRAWIWFYAPFACAVIFSTIYLRMHYVIDDVVGIMLAFAVTAATPHMLQAWTRFQERIGSIPRGQTLPERNSSVNRS